MPREHRGKVVLVTGASSGIGAEIARIAAADGYDLALVARSRGRLERLADELVDRHAVRVHVEPADLADAAERERLHASLGERGIEIHALVNNAGFGSNGPFLELDRVRQVEMVDLNIAAVVDLTHRFAGDMAERGGGRVLNIASTAGFQPGPGMAVYYATKAFVISFGEAVAHELRGSGVTVTTLCPGATATEFASTAGSGESLLFKLQVSSAEEVARDGWRAMMGGRVLSISGLLNRITAFFSVRLVPRGLVRRLAARINR